MKNLLALHSTEFKSINTEINACSIEILYLLNKNMFLKKNEIHKMLNIDTITLSKSIKYLTTSNFISTIDNNIRISSPYFIDSELNILLSFIEPVANIIAKRFIHNKSAIFNSLKEFQSNKQYSTNRIAYHIIGDFILGSYFSQNFIKYNIFNNNFSNIFFILYNNTCYLKLFIDELILKSKIIINKDMEIHQFGNPNYTYTNKLDNSNLSVLELSNLLDAPIFLKSEFEIVTRLSNLLWGLLSNYIRNSFVAFQKLPLSCNTNMYNKDLLPIIWNLIKGRVNQILSDCNYYSPLNNSHLNSIILNDTN